MCKTNVVGEDLRENSCLSVGRNIQRAETLGPSGISAGTRFWKQSSFERINTTSLVLRRKVAHPHFDAGRLPAVNPDGPNITDSHPRELNCILPHVLSLEHTTTERRYDHFLQIGFKSSVNSGNNCRFETDSGDSKISTGIPG